MEYIEQAPKVENKKKKRIFYGVTFSALALAIAGLATGAYFLVSRVFIERMNIEFLEYSSNIDDPEAGITIERVENSENLPSHFRIPNVIDGLPVKEIAASAFAGLHQIESVQFPNTLIAIGENAFSNCQNLSSFNVPSSLTNIGLNAFNGTAWLSAQPEGEVRIGNFLYSYKGKLPSNTAIAGSEETYNQLIASGEYDSVIPLYQTPYMSDGVFANQEGLVYVDYPDTFNNVVNNVFQNCINLETVILGDNVTSIGASAFANCSSLNRVSFPNSLFTIEANAFQNTALSGTLSFGDNLTFIGEGAFRDSPNIVGFVFPKNITSISANLFNGCISLTEVSFANDENSIASKISSIGASSFAGTSLTEFHVPYATRNIAQNAFANCPMLEKIYLLDANEASLDTTKYGLYTVGNQAFMNSPKFKEILLVDGSNNVISNLNEITFPSTLTSFGASSGNSNSFVGTAIEVVNFGKLMTFIPGGFASDVKTLVEVNFHSENSITSIGSSSFKGTSISNIDIPDNVRSIGTNCFENCINLTDVNLPVTSSTFIVSIASFKGCTNLETIDIPAFVGEIAREAFMDCTSLREVNIASSSRLTTIGANAFSGCTSLVTFNLPNTVRSLGEGAFSGCTSMSDFNFSEDAPITFTTISANTFSGTLIESLVLPESISTISANAFSDMTHLNNLTLNNDRVVSLRDANAFNNTLITSNSGAIYVPSNLVDSYKSATNWSMFSEIIYPIA